MTSPMTVAEDPVCGMEVEIEGARLTFEYKDTIYYFCSRGCLLEFMEDPEKYLAPGYEPSM
jgi:YHS domain-containing protein